jgi:hypothetical protein
VATRRGAGRPAAARKISIFSVKKKHKSINTKKIFHNFFHMNSHQVKLNITTIAQCCVWYLVVSSWSSRDGLVEADLNACQRGQ